MQTSLPESDFTPFKICQIEVTPIIRQFQFNFLEITILFSIVAVYLHSFQCTSEFHFFAHSHQHLSPILFDDNHSHRYKVVSHFGFNCILLMTSYAKYLFMYMLTNWKKCIFKLFNHFKNQIVFCLFILILNDICSLYGLYVSTPEKWCTKLLFHFCRVAFHLIKCLFGCAKVLYLMQSQCLFLLLTSYPKFVPKQHQEQISP